MAWLTIWLAPGEPAGLCNKWRRRAPADGRWRHTGRSRRSAGCAGRAGPGKTNKVISLAALIGAAGTMMAPAADIISHRCGPAGADNRRRRRRSARHSALGTGRTKQWTGRAEPLVSVCEIDSPADFLAQTRRRARSFLTSARAHSPARRQTSAAGRPATRAEKSTARQTTGEQPHATRLSARFDLANERVARQNGHFDISFASARLF